AYSISDRYRIQLSVPASTASVSRMWPDKAVHSQRASGIGDVSVMGEGWLFTPRTHANGNIAIGLGVKAPSGSHTIGSRFYTATGAIDFPADQTVQPGDGGWAMLAQSQGFRRITDRVVGYAFGSYMVSPRAHSDVRL